MVWASRLTSTQALHSFIHSVNVFVLHLLEAGALMTKATASGIPERSQLLGETDQDPVSRDARSG